jgi:hypothetical protein
MITQTFLAAVNLLLSRARSYYKNMNEASDSNKCQAAVDLRLVARIDDAKGCIVTVPLPDKDMLLKASSQIEARAWVKNLRLHQN